MRFNILTTYLIYDLYTLYGLPGPTTEIPCRPEHGNKKTGG